MRLHKLLRRQSHPLIERYIGEVITLEDFEEAHRRVAGIFDVMAHGKGNETDIAGTKVEGARLTGRAEHAHARLALDVILPLVGVGVPMQLPHSAGVNLDQGRSGRSNWEDVALARVRGMPEKRSRYAKILGKHLVRYVLEPV